MDRGSEHPGQQRFEKAVSGAYLGRLLKAACPDAPMDADAGSQAVVDLAQGRMPASRPDAAQRGTPMAEVGPDLAALARAILRRSSRLVGASIAALATSIPATGNRCRVVAEGSLFWKAPGYVDDVTDALAATLSGLGRPELRSTVVRVADANLAGAALGAQRT
ncbi:MAG: hypothetical protein FJ109_12565 [Deltaproteobacteria bacterium]|nr:hypothetical protein [Deltaproteobacteria bacterium]